MHRMLFNELLDTCYVTGEFTLRSGIISDHYFDKYQIASNPGLLSEVCYGLTSIISNDTEVVAGIELGSVAFATGVSLITKLPMVLVRNTRKDYGRQRIIEGREIQGKKVCIIEDIITTGTQATIAAVQLRELGAIVKDIACVGIRSYNYGENLAKHSLTISYLLDFNGV